MGILKGSPGLVISGLVADHQRVAMSRYRVRVQLIEWYEVAVDGASLKQAIAEAEELSPPAIRKRGKLLSTETGLADSASIATIATSLPSEMLADPADLHHAFSITTMTRSPALLHPKVPSARMLRRKPCASISRRSMSRQHTFIGPEVLEMPAQPSPTTLPSLGPSATHSWDQPDGRRLELQPGKTLIHWRCTICRRSFVHDLTAQEWYAAFPRVLDFERLDGLPSVGWPKSVQGSIRPRTSRPARPKSILKTHRLASFPCHRLRLAAIADAGGLKAAALPPAWAARPPHQE